MPRLSNRKHGRHISKSRSPARHFEVGVEERLFRHPSQGASDFLLLLLRRRTHVQHIDLYLWWLRSIGGLLRVLTYSGHRQEGNPREKYRNSGHGGILNENRPNSKSQKTLDSRVPARKS